MKFHVEFYPSYTSSFSGMVVSLLHVALIWLRSYTPILYNALSQSLTLCSCYVPVIWT